MIVAWKHIACFMLAMLPIGVWAQNDFRSPVDIPLYLSGTFGEPRGSHFHSGIDIRTNGREGLPIYAIEEGHVSRIKVSATGYGNALYIDHPNGCTSVYAHLQQFNSTIDAYIKKIHYQKQSFELDEYLPPGDLVISKGDTIALSGNSGGSGGPHLHFEIRDTETQIPINPHQYGFLVEDNIAPEVHGIYIYPKEERLSGPEKIKLSKHHGSNYYPLAGQTIAVNTDTFGIGVHTFDRMERSTSSNGIYSILVKVNGQVTYQYQMDRFAFDETRYVQCHMDYKQRVTDRNSVHRCFKLPGSRFSRPYSNVVADGYIVAETTAKQVHIEVSDYNGNTATINFSLVKNTEAKFFKQTLFDHDTVFYFDRSNTFTTDRVSAVFPANTFYSKVFWKFGIDTTIKGQASPTFQIDYEWEPVHRRYDLNLIPDEVSTEHRDHLIIVRTEGDGDITTYPSRWKGTYLHARPKDLGNFHVMLDTIVPEIRPLNFKDGQDISKLSQLNIRIKDNLTDIASYRGTIGGRWVLFQYDAKNDLLFYQQDERLQAGEHILRLSVEDEAGNTAEYSCTIIKK